MLCKWVYGNMLHYFCTHISIIGLSHTKPLLRLIAMLLMYLLLSNGNGPWTDSDRLHGYNTQTRCYIVTLASITTSAHYAFASPFVFSGSW